MKTKMLLTAAAALAAMLLVSAPARAQAGDQPTIASQAPDKKATPAEKAAAKVERKEAVKEAKKEGKMTPAGEGAPNSPEKASGTRAERKAERAEARKQVAADKKAGKIKNPGEAGEPKK